MQQNNNGLSVGMLMVIVVVALALIGNMIGGGSTATSPAVNRDSREHRYATERFKQEGYSAREAQQAADAVIKFHNAQQNR